MATSAVFPGLAVVVVADAAADTRPSGLLLFKLTYLGNIALVFRWCLKRFLARRKGRGEIQKMPRKTQEGLGKRDILLLPIDSKEEELEKRNEGREKEEGYIY